MSEWKDGIYVFKEISNSRKSYTLTTSWRMVYNGELYGGTITPAQTVQKESPRGAQKNSHTYREFTPEERLLYTEQCVQAEAFRRKRADEEQQIIAARQAILDEKQAKFNSGMTLGRRNSELFPEFVRFLNTVCEDETVDMPGAGVALLEYLNLSQPEDCEVFEKSAKHETKYAIFTQSGIFIVEGSFKGDWGSDLKLEHFFDFKICQKAAL